MQSDLYSVSPEDTSDCIREKWDNVKSLLVNKPTFENYLVWSEFTRDIGKLVNTPVEILNEFVFNYEYVTIQPYINYPDRTVAYHHSWIWLLDNPNLSTEAVDFVSKAKGLNVKSKLKVINHPNVGVSTLRRIFKATKSLRLKDAVNERLIE